MKRFLPQLLVSVLLLLVNATASIAQNKFIQPGAQWNYVFNSMFSPGGINISHKYIGDTYINGDTIALLNTYYTNKNDNTCYSYTNTLIKQKGDTIFFKNNLTSQTWQILYNFATPAGQSWTTSFPPTTAALNTYVVMVDSVKTVTINNIPLKQLKVRYFGGPNGVESTLITERIGCHLFMFNYYRQECSTDQPWFKEFICYKDNSIGSVPIGSKPCSYGASVPEINDGSSLNDIHVFPNPAADLINIDLQHAEPNSTLVVHDIFGKKIIEQNIENSTTDFELNTSALSNGLYFLSIVSATRKTHVTKFVVSH